MNALQRGILAGLVVAVVALVMEIVTEAYEAQNEDIKTIWMFYSTKSAEESVYHNEIEQLAARSSDQFRYVQHVRQAHGRLTVTTIQGHVGDLKGFAVLLCGPPAMMNDLKKQFVALGVPASQIFFEDFSFV